MRYFITLSYDGTQYHGWQKQPNVRTIQAELEHALRLLLRENIEIIGAGRTDTGVHATTMVAHFNTKIKIESDETVRRMNSILPHDIAIRDIIHVEETLHARYSATERTYHYFIHTRKDPFLVGYSYELRYSLDFESMNKAAQILLFYHDFAAFCKSHSGAKTTLCHIYKAQWEQQSPYRWCFKITADRFLRNMVRAITGTLIDVGRGRISTKEFENIIQNRQRSQAGESVPACALYLVDIKYP